MNKEEIQDILDELHLVRPEILQPKAKKLFEAIMSIADERDNLLEEVERQKERIDYLERSNNRREETIELERKENLELHNKIDKLSNENQSLRTRIKTIKRLRKKQTQKKNKYKSIVIEFQKALEKKNNKIDKAIKYMDNTFNISSVKDMFDIMNRLEEILKDSDVDE